MLPNRRILFREQPQNLPSLDWSNPLTRGLVFCAVPVGNTFIDLVTGVMGSQQGTVSPGVFPQKEGFSRSGTIKGNTSAGTTSDYIVWPVSLQRGGSITTQGTILALAGSTEQVDGNNYVVGGNTEAVTIGDGFSLHIDSFAFLGRGNILSGRFNGPSHGSSTNLLGNPFDKRTHLFGYSFTGGGGASLGTYWGARKGETANTPVFGTTTTNRRAIIHKASTGATVGSAKAYVGLMLIYDRAISLSEYQQLYDNVWQLFTPSTRKFYVPDGGAAGSTGTLAVTAGSDTLAAAGTTTIVGTLARTAANDTLSAAGTPTIVGTLSRTNANDTLAAAGSVGNPVSGSANVTAGSDTLAAAGTTTIVGTLARTGGNDTVVSSGTTTVLGTLARTEGADTLAASGAVGSGSSGSANITAGNDTLAAAGTTTVRGTAAITAGSDTLSAAGKTTIVGSASITAGNDTSTASGYVGVPPSTAAWRILALFIDRMRL